MTLDPKIIYMKVGLNLLYLIPSVVGGTETYAVSLIRAMTNEFPKDEFVVFLNEEASSLALRDQKSVYGRKIQHDLTNVEKWGYTI
jgi:hypothetical protein